MDDLRAVPWSEVTREMLVGEWGELEGCRYVGRRLEPWGLNNWASVSPELMGILCPKHRLDYAIPAGLSPFHFPWEVR